ncbi:hypothetical protein BHE74_00037679 [Ensete ventricosum]|nr:hypothetical protein BHE74_00037679 [Ensete ventricosum]
MGSRRKFARRFVEGIGKLTGNAKGDCREEDQRTCHKITAGCRNMQETRVAANSFRWVNHPYVGIRAAEPPRLVGKPPVPRFFEYGWILAPILKPIWSL